MIMQVIPHMNARQEAAEQQASAVATGVQQLHSRLSQLEAQAQPSFSQGPHAHLPQNAPRAEEEESDSRYTPDSSDPETEQPPLQPLRLVNSNCNCDADTFISCRCQPPTE